MTCILWAFFIFSLFKLSPKRSVYGRGRLLTKFHTTRSKRSFNSAFNRYFSGYKREEHSDISINLDRFRVKCKSGFWMEWERYATGITRTGVPIKDWYFVQLGVLHICTNSDSGRVTENLNVSFKIFPYQILRPQTTLGQRFSIWQWWLRKIYRTASFCGYQ